MKATSLLRAVVRLEDLDGDGLFQTAGEVRRHFEYPTDAPEMVVEALFAAGDSLSPDHRDAAPLLRIIARIEEKIARLNAGGSAGTDASGSAEAGGPTRS